MDNSTESLATTLLWVCSSFRIKSVTHSPFWKDLEGILCVPGQIQLRGGKDHFQISSSADLAANLKTTQLDDAVLKAISVSKQPVNKRDGITPETNAPYGHQSAGHHHLVYLLCVIKIVCIWAGHRAADLDEEDAAAWNQRVTAPGHHSMEEYPLPLFSTTLVCFLLLSCWTPWISIVTLGSTIEFLLLFTLGSCWPEMICGGKRAKDQDAGKRDWFRLFLQDYRTCCWCWSFRASIVTLFRGSFNDLKHLMKCCQSKRQLLYLSPAWLGDTWKQQWWMLMCLTWLYVHL